MKVKVKRVSSYEITIGDHTYTDFTRGEEWEGMVKFSGAQGSVIVSKCESDVAAIFSDIFGRGVSKGEPIELNVIMIDQRLLPKEDKS